MRIIILLFTIVLGCTLLGVSSVLCYERELFSIDSKFEDSLKKEIISNDLRDEINHQLIKLYNDNKIVYEKQLSDDIKGIEIWAEESGKKWQIIDKGYKNDVYNNELNDCINDCVYIVKKEEECLRVYQEVAPLDLIICIDASKSVDIEKAKYALKYILDYVYKYGFFTQKLDRIYIGKFGEMASPIFSRERTTQGGPEIIKYFSPQELTPKDKKELEKSINDLKYSDKDTGFKSLLTDLRKNLQLFYADRKHVRYDSRRVVLIISDGIDEPQLKEEEITKDDLCLWLVCNDRDKNVKLDSQIILVKIPSNLSMYKESNKERSDEFWEMPDVKKWVKKIDFSVNNWEHKELISELYKNLDDSRCTRKTYIELVHDKEENNIPVISIMTDESSDNLALEIRYVTNYENDHSLDYVSIKRPFGLKPFLDSKDTLLDFCEQVIISGKGTGYPNYKEAYAASEVKEAFFKAIFHPRSDIAEEEPLRIKLVGKGTGYNLKVDNTTKLIRISHSESNSVSFKSPLYVFTHKNKKSMKFNLNRINETILDKSRFRATIDNIPIYEDGKPKEYIFDVSSIANSKKNNWIFSYDFIIHVASKDDDGQEIQMGEKKITVKFVYASILRVIFASVVLFVAVIFLGYHWMIRKSHSKGKALIYSILPFGLCTIVFLVLFNPHISFDNILEVSGFTTLIEAFILIIFAIIKYSKYDDTPHKGNYVAFFWILLIPPPALLLFLLIFDMVILRAIFSFDFLFIIVFFIIIIMIILLYNKIQNYIYSKFGKKDKVIEK